MAHSSATCAASEGRFRLAGRVAGIDACQLISDCDTVIVGSGVDCDLVVTDPLVPRRAFRLLRQRDHFESERDCRTYWLLETYPGARVYVNNDHVKRGRVTLGDTIALGCHQFQFTVASPIGRNSESNIEIDDLCDQLIKPVELPHGYLESCPSWANRRRVRVAGAWATVLSVLILGAGLLIPREEKFIQMQPPMEIVMLSNEQLPEAQPGDVPSAVQRKTSPQQRSVRSLDQVQRKTIAEPTGETAGGDILASQVDSVKTLETAPVQTGGAEQMAKPDAPHLDHVAVDAAPGLPSLQMSRSEQPQAEVTRTLAKLEVGTQGQSRRLSVEEANDPVMQKELGDVGVKISSNTFINANGAGGVAGSGTRVASMGQSGPVTRSVAKPGQVKIEGNRAGQLASMESYKASPLKFEQYDGVQLPVARLPGELNLVGVDDERASLNGKANGAIVVDGNVSETEMAFTWKSGQFHSHAAGSPPPLANPATYCYVGRKEQDGKQYLYVSFICKDPNVNQLVATKGNGDVHLTADDSIEIFLDTTRGRRQYYQMIVNASGNWWSGSVHNSGNGKYDPSGSWNAQAIVKAMKNETAGQWSCEILVPFDQLGGVPAKGSSWGVNFCRNFRGQSPDPAHLQTWFSVYDKSPNFHNPELFGRFDW